MPRTSQPNVLPLTMPPKRSHLQSPNPAKHQISERQDDRTPTIVSPAPLSRVQSGPVTLRGIVASQFPPWPLTQSSPHHQIQLQLVSSVSKRILWVQMMQQIVPFASNVFVAGSAATWLSEYSIHQMRPSWSPSDVDIFVLHNSEAEFLLLVDSVVALLLVWIKHESDPGLAIQFHVIRKHPHIIEIMWWNTAIGTGHQHPLFSFINCSNITSEEDVLDGFDIDICKVSLNWDGRQLRLRMSQVVHDSLINRCFHCVVQQRCRIPFYCPMQKTITRVLKYYRRGYNFKSIIFLPPTDNVQPSTPTSSHFVVSAAEVTNHA